MLRIRHWMLISWFTVSTITDDLNAPSSLIYFEYSIVSTFSSLRTYPKFLNFISRLILVQIVSQCGPRLVSIFFSFSGQPSIKCSLKIRQPTVQRQNPTVARVDLFHHLHLCFLHSYIPSTQPPEFWSPLLFPLLISLTKTPSSRTISSQTTTWQTSPPMISQENFSWTVPQGYERHLLENWLKVIMNEQIRCNSRTINWICPCLWRHQTRASRLPETWMVRSRHRLQEMLKIIQQVLKMQQMLRIQIVQVLMQLSLKAQRVTWMEHWLAKSPDASNNKITWTTVFFSRDVAFIVWSKVDWTREFFDEIFCNRNYMFIFSGGIKGKKCLLLAICEASRFPFIDNNGVLGNIIHIILT